MSNLPRVSPRAAIVTVALLLLASTFLLVRQPQDTKTVTAHFPRAVSVYKGTDVRILGVNVGPTSSCPRTPRPWW
jgi:phospholipid/cholesterol/gamma-HCH transport system substrate-binding protein